MAGSRPVSLLKTKIAAETTSSLDECTFFVGCPPGGHTSLGAAQQAIVYQTPPASGQQCRTGIPGCPLRVIPVLLIPRARRRSGPLEQRGALERSRPAAPPIRAPLPPQHKSADRSASPQTAVLAGVASAKALRTSPSRRQPAPAPSPAPESCAEFPPDAHRWPCARQSHASAARRPRPSLRRCPLPRLQAPAWRTSPTSSWSAAARQRIPHVPVQAPALAPLVG